MPRKNGSKPVVCFEKTEGFIAACHTPMDAAGDIRLDLIYAQAEFLARNGVAGVFVNGTTGEGVSLTMAERMAVVERWAAVAPEGFRVIVHVGHLCLRDSRTLADHAQKTGAWGIGSMPPIFFRPRSVEELAACCAEIASAAPGLPFYYYHIPSMTGVSLPMGPFLARAHESIPNVGGLKFTSEDLMDYAACLGVAGGQMDCLFGRDEILLSALVLGARGAIGSTYNFAAPLYRRIVETFDAGDLQAARRLQKLSMAMIRTILSCGSGVAGFKAVSAMVGLDLGPVRPPLRALSREQQTALHEELEQIGFFEWCAK